MPFWNLLEVPLQDFRPGIRSAAQVGAQLIMVVMTIEPGLEDSGHSHPFDQCGMVLEGSFSLTIGGETQTLGPNRGYFIPAGAPHRWSNNGEVSVKILDVSVKTG